MTPAPPKRGPGRPRKPEPVPVDDPGADLAMRIRTAIVEKGISAIEMEMNILTEPPVSTDSVARIVVLTEKSATIMGHVRRADESLRNAGRKLSLPVVLSWIDAQSEDVKGQIAERCGGTERGGSVLG